MSCSLEVVNGGLKRPQVVRDFDFIFCQSVLGGLRSILGEDGKRAVVKNYNLLRLIDYPEYVHHVLVSVFEESGATVLEGAILNELFARIDENLPERGREGFVTYANLARNLYARGKGRTHMMTPDRDFVQLGVPNPTESSPLHEEERNTLHS